MGTTDSLFIHSNTTVQEEKMAMPTPFRLTSLPFLYHFFTAFCFSRLNGVVLQSPNPILVRDKRLCCDASFFNARVSRRDGHPLSIRCFLLEIGQRAALQRIQTPQRLRKKTCTMLMLWVTPF